MSFQIKDFASIVASQINWMRANTTRVTDFNLGSVVRTMMEAAAIEIEESYLQYFVGLKEAIPVSVFETFGFPAISAEAAGGILRFSTAAAATSNILIPAGTVVKAAVSEQNYATTAAASILIGQTYVDVLGAAQAAGVVGNADAGTITTLVTTVSGVAAVTNPAPWINGRDVETDDERKTRFQGFIGTLARGTKAAVEYGAKTARISNAAGVVTEYVAFATVVEPWIADSAQPIALVRVYVHNGAGATSAELVALAQKVVDGYYGADGITPVPGSGWKAAGVQCIVSAAADVPVAVTGDVFVGAGNNAVEVVAAATRAVQAYIQGLTVGADVLLSEIVAIVMRDVVGVYNVVLSAPATDLAISASQKAIPGAVTLTAI